MQQSLSKSSIYCILNFLPPIQLIWMTQFFLVLKAYSHSVYVHWMRHVFSNKRIKKNYDAIFWGYDF